MSVYLMLFTSLVLTLGCFVAIWAVHVRLKDAGIVDIFWGPGFGLIALHHVFLFQNPFLEKIIFLLFTITWSLRLGYHIGKRHHLSHDEDRRYKRMRNNGGASFWWTSLFKIFLLQGALMWLIATPQHIALLTASPPQTTISASTFYMGVGLFLFGFIFEVVADLQLSRFRNTPSNDGKTMRSGLWAYSRHPNYFGESVLWWGFGLMAFGLSANWIAFIGPALITFLIIKVSGVRLLETHLGPDKEGYDDYQTTTSAFIPWFPAPPEGKK